MAEISVTFHRAEMNKFLNKVVQPYLVKQAQEIAKEAQARAPVGATGDLRSSITVKTASRGRVEIKVEAPHAGFVHQGTGPQAQPSPRPPYFPKLRRSGLILWSEAKGANSYAVAHGISTKGTPANPFLTESIEKVLGRYDFKWIRRDVIGAG